MIQPLVFSLIFSEESLM